MAYIQSCMLVLVLVAVTTSGSTLDDVLRPSTTPRPTHGRAQDALRHGDVTQDALRHGDVTGDALRHGDVTRVHDAVRDAVREDDVRWAEEVEQEEDDDRRWDSPYLRDVLDWAETHANTNRITKRKLTLGGLKTEVEAAKAAVQAGTCGQRTLRSCDLRTMSQLGMEDDSPCTLLQEYRMCVARESARCPSGDGALLQTAIRHLVVGLQQQGHCAALNTQPEVAAADRHAQPCMRKGAWMCVNSFTEDLKMFDVPTCTSVANFRHCLHTSSSSCNHDSANLLIRGSKGLARLYRRLTEEC